MARDDKIHMPSGMGGLVRYFDEYKSKITFKPGHVMVMIVVIVIVVIILHWQGSAWLGLE
ncbi:MAG TPA: preprotein translocase subunit Sec61beta [Candidatus Nanoarchaeia archaeon]|nr:preprotein translocase subunit Sec61beta [Candidatus Nanoarchaeia archaeon]